MNQISPELKVLQDDLFRSKVARARRMSIDERMTEGARLFDRCLQQMRDGIASLHPEYTDVQIENEVARRLRIARRLDDSGLYRKVESAAHEQ